MIENEQQYHLTKGLIQDFERTLDNCDKDPENKRIENPLLYDLQKAAVASQLESLRGEALEWEQRQLQNKSIHIDLPNSLYNLLEFLSHDNGESIEKYLLNFIRERITPEEQELYLRKLARRGNRIKYDAVLAKVPEGEIERRCN